MYRMSANINRIRLLSSHIQVKKSNDLRNYSNSTKTQRKYDAVIFDMGGVLIPSPFHLFQSFENELNLPVHTITSAIIKGGENGAWGKFERGELLPDEFSDMFSKECSEQLGRSVNLTSFVNKLVAPHDSEIPMFSEMKDAIQCIKAEGLKTALLTNNFLSGSQTSYCPIDKSLFDVVVESCVVKMRKPNTEIYQYTLDQLNVEPNKAIFLDDLGHNLKSAKSLGIKTFKVEENKKDVIKQLENELGFELQGFVPGTTSVPERLKLPINKLRSYLNWVLKIHSKGDNDKEMPIVRCFEHGQSNPTYFIRYANKDLVLRKKPPGKILKSAHAVEREYRIMKAMREQGVPVPKVLHLMKETELLGTPFYVMEHVKGRIFKKASADELSPDERRKVYEAMNDVLCKIHNVNIKTAELEDYGKHVDYMKRNIERWCKQYDASKTKDIKSFEKLRHWLKDNLTENKECTVVHGDFRLDNLIFHDNKPEVIAVLDWELSTLGDPITDLATNCVTYYFPKNFPASGGFNGLNLQEMGIPSISEYLDAYFKKRNLEFITNWNFYMAFIMFRFAAILQGVYKRAISGQASSTDAEESGAFAEFIADLGWKIASEDNNFKSIKPNTNISNQRKDKFSTMSSFNRNHNIPGALPLSVSALSENAQNIHKRVKKFINQYIIPIEKEMLEYHKNESTKWTINPRIEELKNMARQQGLWNLFLPIESDPDKKYGAGLTNIEYAFLCEEMGRSPLSSEIFNCSAPDTGNMEVLIRYGNSEQKELWLKPLLEGKIRSCFGMTEPNVASSDATNIQTSIKHDNDSYVINGRKWWTSGAMDPRCKLCILMGKTDTKTDIHKQQSMIVVPMNTPGVKIIRPLSVFGNEDAPHGHAEVDFNNVRVPLKNILLGEGRGFEIAQGRLGPGRIHHCMRLIGAAERSLELMIERVQNRVAFGKPIVTQGTIQADIANSRIEIEQCRLLTLKAAYMMDTVGNKVAAQEIAMIKIAAPNMALRVIDRAIQAFGGAGVHNDVPLSMFFAYARTLRLADGPDEVHRRSLAKMEIQKANLSKL